MKGQFFIMATVIMIYTLMTMTHYIYDFSNVNLIQLKKMPQLFYMKDIKDALNRTVTSSSQSLDCNKLETDLDATENFLKNEMISRGIVLTINHAVDCSSLNACFYISLKADEFYVSSGNSNLAQQSSNWLSGWQHRKSHLIQSATGADVNYQVKINVINGFGIDSGDTVYINNEMKSDFGDIRFTNLAGGLLNYWIESVNNGVNATFWVQIDGNLASASQTIYMYYGNSAATSVSNGDNTFLFFDNFDGTSINTTKWTISGTPTESGGYLHLYNVGDYVQGNTNFSYKAMRFSANLSTGSGFPTAGFRMAAGGGYAKIIGNYNATGWVTDYMSSDGVNTFAGKNITATNAWHIYDILWRSGEAKFYVDNSLNDTRTDHVTSNTLPVLFLEQISNTAFTVDWAFVRNYVSPEPAQGSWGNEETLSCTFQGPAPFDGVLWFKFNEGSGTKAFDSSPYGNDGTFYGETFSDGTCIPGSGSCPSRVSVNNGYFSSKALNFDGVNDYVDVADNSNLHLTGNFTIDAWIWLNNNQSSGYPDIVSKSNGNPDLADEWAFYIDNSSNSIAFKANNNPFYGNSVSRNSWQMVTAQRVGNNLQLYINGAPAGSSANFFSGLSFASTYDINIGRRGDATNPFNGTIDEVRIWNRTLSQTEIQNEMQSSMPISRPVASYSFEEPTDATYVNDTHIWVNRTYGSAMSFDGNDDYLKVNSVFGGITQPITIGFWLRFEDSNIYVFNNTWPIIIGDSASQNHIIKVDWGPHRVQYIIVNNTGLPTLTNDYDITDNNWHYITAMANSTHIELLIDNNIKEIKAYSGTIRTPATYTTIGLSTAGSLYRTHDIDNVKIWNRILSQTEIDAEMNSS